MIDFLNRPMVRVVSSTAVFALMMFGVVWLSSGVLE